MVLSAHGLNFLDVPHWQNTTTCIRIRKMIIHKKKKKIIIPSPSKMICILYIIVKKQFEEQVNIIVVKHGYFLNWHCFVHLLILSLKKQLLYANRNMCVPGCNDALIIWLERFTGEVPSLIQVEISLILFQGCSHQQERHSDARRMLFIDL